MTNDRAAPSGQEAGDAPGAALTALLRSTIIARARLHQATRPHRLTWTAIDILIVVVEHQRLLLHQVVAATAIPKATVASAVRELVRRRLLTRTGVGDDLRQVLLIPTQNGRDLHHRLLPVIHLVEARLMPDPQIRAAVVAVARQIDRAAGG